MRMTKETRENYYKYILDCIDAENYGVDVKTDAEKLRFLHDTFVKEYWQGLHITRYKTKENGFREYIAGLPSCFNIDFTNFDIINLAKRMGSLPENASEKQEDKIIENYFSFIAHLTFRLFEKYGIN